MKLAMLYTRVVGKSEPDANDPSYYKPYEERFARTLIEYKPKQSFDLIVCDCGGESNEDFYGIEHIKTVYIGPGWDIGAYQAIVPFLDYDFVMCCASPVYFKEMDWLSPFVDAFCKYGQGIYAPMASYENNPHLRTGCFAISPKVFASYPLRIKCRKESQCFESGLNGISSWAISCGIPTMMVTRSECLSFDKWRGPDNIFMRGDQSNCLTWDRHNDIYFQADDTEKARLERVADGKEPR